ncbi:MAG: sensor histidine kinase [Minisyncoccia bacterium]|jgi:signal transduction histidine kinase
MNKDKFPLFSYFILLLITGFLLFLQEFNQLKLGILFLIGLIIIIILIWFYFSKEELFSKKKPFFEELENFLNFLNTAICFYDDNYKVKFVNNAFTKLVELNKENLLNVEIGTWIVKNPVYFNLALIFFPSITATSIEVLDSDKDYETINVEWQNKIYWTIVTTKILFKNEKYNCKIVIDRTPLISKEKEEVEFLNLVAHHLRTPLNQIKWMLESIDKNKLDDPSLIDNALFIIDKTIFLAESILIANKLETKKLELNVQKNDIEELIKSSLSLLEYSINEKKLKVKIEIDENAKEFYFDKNLMFFILFPLLENAVDYNKEGGEVLVEIKKLEERPYVLIKIKDTGIGMSEKELNKIFTKYFRSEKAKELKPTGFGLGMYIAYNLLSLHKGKIEIKSKENEGTEIILEIPAYKEIYDYNLINGGKS